MVARVWTLLMVTRVRVWLATRTPTVRQVCQARVQYWNRPTLQPTILVKIPLFK